MIGCAMPRAHSIPIVGLVLSLACNQQPEAGSTNGSTTADVTGGTLGGSETGPVVPVTGIDDGATTMDGGASSTGAVQTTSETTSTGTDASSSSGGLDGSSSGSSGTSGSSCFGAVGDATNLPDPHHDCDPEPCPSGEVCVVRISCPEIPNLCDDDDIPEYEDTCYVEQHPTYCVPIPPKCSQDPRTQTDCLEAQDDLCNYDECLCRYGGDYYEGILFCFYVSDQCMEGDITPECDELYP
jgi:hypothetical protein